MIHPPPVRPEEPIAVTPHDGICGGESQQWLSYPTNLHVRGAKVGEMIARMRQVVIRMETFGAKPSTPLAACRAEAASCVPRRSRAIRCPNCDHRTPLRLGP